MINDYKVFWHWYADILEPFTAFTNVMDKYFHKNWKTEQLVCFIKGKETIAQEIMLK